MEQPRIDIYPTHKVGDYWLRAGRPIPFGASFVPGGVNFSVFSRDAAGCTLVLYQRGRDEPVADIPFPDEFRVGNVFAMIVFGLDSENTEYGIRMSGEYAPHKGLHFDESRVLLDPYARAISGRSRFAGANDHDAPPPYRARLVHDDFDWTGDRPLEKPIEDLVIYEMHVRGFTRHPSSGVKFPGAFAAVREKIPYLMELGVNCVELMPVHEFDECLLEFTNPFTGRRNVNYWGYSPVGIFAPKAGYASTGPLGMQVDELKALVKLLHRHDIEVILDVVFNHTAERGEDGMTFSLRGLDNRTYYMLRPDGGFQNFSGCGNTLNCSNPVVRNMVVDCLRYWVSEYHIDGFRFDLASILGRDSHGHPLANPPLLEALAFDPVLGRTKLIAEAWDAGGLYQVGAFPSYGRWTEWNGKYRDALRRFVRGDMGCTPEMALRIQGSPDLYSGRGSIASVNFVTCHDGFTLRDLFSYDEKHNLANGEDNRDGANDNWSWNCGVEGETDDPAINALRRRLMKNALAILMVSQGVPLIHMGDEIAHTKQGNNNTYCQDNELSWFDWSRVESEQEMVRFFRGCIAFRRAHHVLRNEEHLTGEDRVGSGYPDISWHGLEAWEPDWSSHVRTLAFMLCGRHVSGADGADDYVYVAMNMHWEGYTFELPLLPRGMTWRRFVDTAAAYPNDIQPVGEEPRLPNQRRLPVGPRSVVILVGR